MAAMADRGYLEFGLYRDRNDHRRGLTSGATETAVAAL